MFRFLRRLRQDQRGVTAVEYALLAAIIAVGITAAAGTLKSNIAGAFATVGSTINPSS
jgi:pilus assembly protein Flp/PilA